MQFFKINILVITLLLVTEVTAVSLFNDLQDKDKERARMCSQFQKKLHKAERSTDKADSEQIERYQKRIDLYCPPKTETNSLFSTLQNEEAESVHLCKMFHTKAEKLKEKDPLNDSEKKRLESYQKRVRLYCK